MSDLPAGERGGPVERLATYGTLSPGQVNHHYLADLAGTWRVGTVRGWRYDSGWGAAEGFPGLVLDADGREVVVHLLSSRDLPARWPVLDEFEGPGYRRVLVPVQTDEGIVEAWIYALADDAVPPTR